MNVKRSIYSFVQDGRAECDFIVDRMPNSGNRKSSSLCMSKKVRKNLGSSLYIKSMEKVKQFFVISNQRSENWSGINVGYVYHCRETAV